MKKVIVSAIFAASVILAGAAQAKRPTVAGLPVLLECKIKKSGTQRGWVPLEIYILEGPNGPMVMDGFVFETEGENPVAAKIGTNNSARTGYSWKIDGLMSSSNQHVRMRLQMMVEKPSGKVRVTNQFVNYDGTLSGEGTCKRY